MDTLDLVREFRDSVPEPDEARTALARAAVVAALAGDPDPTPTRRPARRRLPRLARASLVAAAASVLALAVVSGAFRVPRADPAVAASVDQAVLAVVARSGQEDLTAGGYWYRQVERTHLADAVETSSGAYLKALVPTTIETWEGRDGSGAERVTTHDWVHVTPAERARWEAATRAGEAPSVAPPTGDDRRAATNRQRERNAAREPSNGQDPKLDARWSAEDRDGNAVGELEAVRRLPADPDVLYRHFLDQALAARNGDGGLGALLARALDRLRPQEANLEMFRAITDTVVNTQGLPPKLSAAMYRTASRIPGVELVAPAVDPLGRAGMALSLTGADGSRDELIFDPVTAAPLASRMVVSRPGSAFLPDAPPGTIIRQVVVIETGVADKLGAVPRT